MGVQSLTGGNATNRVQVAADDRPQTLKVQTARLAASHWWNELLDAFGLERGGN